MHYFNENLTKPRWGNTRVEAGEQCDCGSFKQCYNKKCCQQYCKFQGDAVCNTGLCCINYMYSEPGTLCRQIQNICDLPEYCFGTTNQCPAGFYMQDRTPYTEEGYCYCGNCTDHTMHYREIFGRHTHNGNDECYIINSRGRQFGHCTRDYRHLRFHACGANDHKCGRLQCVNVTHLLQLQDVFHSFSQRCQVFGVGD